jgi:hypothetical protein
VSTLPDLSALSDVPELPDGFSDKLAAVVACLPKTTRVRIANALYNAHVSTLAGLCQKKKSDMRRWKNMGHKMIGDVEVVLEGFGLSLAGPAPGRDKPLTANQRVSNAPWIREQLREILSDCDDNIIEDQERAEKERDDAMRARYEASIDCHKHFRKQISRILVGKTAIEAIADLVKGSAA